MACVLRCRVDGARAVPRRAAQVFAYIWLLIILMVSSPNVVEPWEAILTFLFFPFLTALAYAADKGYLDTCASKVAPESRVTAIGGLHFHAYDFRALMAQLRHPETTHEERQAIVAKLSTTTKKAKPSRAVQRMNATRSAIGKKAIQQNAPDPAALEKYLARSRRPVVFVSIRRGRGWFLCRIRVETAMLRAGEDQRRQEARS